MTTQTQMPEPGLHTNDRQTAAYGLNGRAPRRRSAAGSWWFAGVLAVLIVVAPYAWLPLHRYMAAPPAAAVAPAPVVPAAHSSIGFAAVRQNADWKLTWDRESIAKLDPVGAILTIRDGGLERQSFLTARDLTDAVIIYTPRSGEVAFTLKLSAPGRNDLEEEIRVFGPEGTPPPGAVNAGVRETLLPPVLAAAGPSDGRAGVEEGRERRPFSLKTTAAPEAKRPELAAAPELQFGSPASGALPSLLGSIAAAPRPEPAADLKKPAPTPAVRHIDPIPIRQVSPVWPEQVPRVGSSVVRIIVQVDAKGRVTAARPLQPSGVKFALITSALMAARKWTFAPAQDNGQAVASEFLLRFEFSPKQ